MGNALYDQGKLDLAIEKYEEAIRLNPKYSTAYSNLGWLNLLIKQYQEAQQTLQKLWKLLNGKTSFYAPMNLGHAYLLQQKEADAISWYQKAIQRCEEEKQIKEFFQGMQEDYKELKMQEEGIIQETYTAILQQLKKV